MPQVVGRKSKKRTTDVQLSDVSFSQLFLSKELQLGLENAGFTKPSPIQLQAIPVGIFGSDLIAQAKAGTGKTLVFSTIALEIIDKSNLQPQVLIMAPTREIAHQISTVITTISSNYEPKVKTCLCIGGYPISVDSKIISKGVHIIIGTPGRILSLIRASILNCTTVKLIALDEADKLLEDSFEIQIA